MSERYGSMSQIDKYDRSDIRAGAVWRGPVSAEIAMYRPAWSVTFEEW